MGYTGVVTEPAVIETDDRSRAVLPGRPNQRFVMRENPDGSLLLQPARVVTDAQHEFDSDPELAAEANCRLGFRASQSADWDGRAALHGCGHRFL